MKMYKELFFHFANPTDKPQTQTINQIKFNSENRDFANFHFNFQDLSAFETCSYFDQAHGKPGKYCRKHHNIWKVNQDLDMIYALLDLCVLHACRIQCSANSQAMAFHTQPHSGHTGQRRTDRQNRLWFSSVLNREREPTEDHFHNRFSRPRFRFVFVSFGPLKVSSCAPAPLPPSPWKRIRE